MGSQASNAPPAPPGEPEVQRTFDRRGARAMEHEARPPASFSSLRSEETVNQKQEPWGNTLLAQRTRFAGNSYFWRTAGSRFRIYSCRLHSRTLSPLAGL